MKYIIFSIFIISSSISAVNGIKQHNSLSDDIRSYCYSLGSKLDSIELPHIGKINTILPCAVVIFALQKFPLQTLFCSATLLLWSRWKKKKQRSLLTKKNKPFFFNEDVFVLDGEDVIDVLENDSSEDRSVEDGDYIDAISPFNKQDLRFL